MPMNPSKVPEKRKNQLRKNLVDWVNGSVVEARSGAVTSILAMLTKIINPPIGSPVPKTGTSMFATSPPPAKESELRDETSHMMGQVCATVKVSGPCQSPFALHSEHT